MSGICRRLPLLAIGLAAVFLNGALPLAAAAQTAATVQTPMSVAGQVGRRQGADQIASDILPYERLQGRVQNRVQNRVRNRIDEYYDPQANAASPFAVASDRARTAAAGPTRR